MFEWMLLPFRRYFDFSGRSRRREYWSFQLLGLVISSVAFILVVSGAGDEVRTAEYKYVDATTSTQASFTGNLGIISWMGLALIFVWAIVAFVPSLALTVRRLHDRDKSGLYILLTFIPLIGLIFSIIMLVNMLLAGTIGRNRFGPDPKTGMIDRDVFE